MYIITGAAGFIGSALLWELNRRGIDDILVVDNLKTSEKWRNLQKRSYMDYMHRDKFLKLVQSGQWSDKVDGLVHLGACSSTTEMDADFLMENNFHYSRDLCKFAIAKDIRFINASSAATYGAGENGFSDKANGLAALRPLNMYGYSKHLFDLWLARQGFPKNSVSLKFFNVFGPNEYHKGDMRSVAVKLFNEIGATGRASLFESARGDIAHGEQKRDFIYVKDCAGLLADLLLERPDIHGIRNAGTGLAHSFNELAIAVFAAMRRPVNIAYVPAPEAISRKYQYYTCANMDWLAGAGLNMSFTPFAKAIDDYVGYLESEDPYL